MRRKSKISRFQLYARELSPLFRELIADGAQSFEQIAAELNRRGIPRHNGKDWCGKPIVRALRYAVPELVEIVRRRGHRLGGRPPGADLGPAHRVNQQRADEYAAQMLRVMRELIGKGFTPILMAGELNRLGMRGRYGKEWSEATVRKTVQRADPVLYEKWNAWRAGRRVWRDLDRLDERNQKNLQRIHQEAAAYRKELVRIVEPLIAAGHDTASKLVLELARLRVPTAKGGRWCHGTVLRMLKRETPRLYRIIRPRSPSERGVRFAAELRPLIDDLIAHGISRPSAIARELDRRGVPTARGCPHWGHQAAHNLLRRLGYAGPQKKHGDRLLTPRELAERLGVQEADIRAAARRGKLVGIGDGRSIRFAPDAVERALYMHARAARRRRS
jgi:excisionase family DNA binding protein